MTGLKRFAAPALCLVCLAGPAWAGAREAVTAASASCMNILDDRAWLDCYYGAAQPMRAQLGLPPAPSSQVRMVPGFVQGAPLTAALPPPPPAAPMAARPAAVQPQQGAGLRMTTYSFNKHGMFTVTLNDGEVWKQLEGDTNIAQWRKPAASYAVKVSVGALGSANMRVSGDPNVFKVQRVQ